MDKAKFTPGPWLVEESNRGHVILMGNALDEAEEFDAQCEVLYDHECYYADELSKDHPMNIQADEAGANAFLMAAAPDLYEALDQAMEAMDHALKHDKGLGLSLEGFLNQAIEVGANALAKAEANRLILPKEVTLHRTCMICWEVRECNK